MYDTSHCTTRQSNTNHHGFVRGLTHALLATLLTVLMASTASAQVGTLDLPKRIALDTNVTTFTGLWRPTGGVVEARHASTAEAFEADRAELSGWRLVDLEHRLDHWAGLWRPSSDEGELDRVVIDIAPADLASTQTAQRNDGFELVDLEVERRGGVVRIDGLFHPGVAQHEVHLDLDFGDFPALQTQLAGEDKVLVDIETYLDAGGTRRWAGLWKQLAPAAQMPDVLVAHAAPGTNEAGNLIDNQDRHPIDFETYSEQGGWMIAGLWQTTGSNDDWFRGIAGWSEIAERADALTPDPGGFVVSGLKKLVDVDIVASLSGNLVRPMPVDHDGPVGPGGP